jgi:tol-pal system-associated acyl-CoA thioesterase
MSEVHVFPVSVYYEDTDFSGLVYHANYLKYFERAREHFLGREELVRLWRETGIGFVVYKLEMGFREGAVFGDDLEIRTTVDLKSQYRAVFVQQAWKPGGKAPMVDARIDLVCVDTDNKLTKLPPDVQERGRRYAAQ